MKNIYVNNDILKEAVDYINNEITFFGFLSHVKSFLKKLLTTPLNADIDDYLKEHGLDKTVLLDKLMEKGIVEKDTKIIDINGKDKFSITYKVISRNFERKMRRLYTTFFEKNEIKESVITEEEGGMGGGATSCSDSGQYVAPFGKPQRRKIYVTEKQCHMLQEMGTVDAGNYQYDVPFNFGNGDDPAYDHQNIMAKSFPNKKQGIRRKQK